MLLCLNVLTMWTYRIRLAVVSLCPLSWYQTMM